MNLTLPPLYLRSLTPSTTMNLVSWASVLLSANHDNVPLPATDTIASSSSSSSFPFGRSEATQLLNTLEMVYLHMLM